MKKQVLDYIKANSKFLQKKEDKCIIEFKGRCVIKYGTDQSILYENKVHDYLLNKFPTEYKLYFATKIEFFVDNENSYLVTERCAKTLDDLMDESKNKKSTMANIVGQLHIILSFLEQNKMSHNDLFTNNIVIDNNNCLKLIDLETFCAYNELIAPQVISADANERKRIGWSKTFTIGSDANQIFGTLFDEYVDYAPQSICSRIIKIEKEFPYAINFENMSLQSKELSQEVVTFGKPKKNVK